MIYLSHVHIIAYVVLKFQHNGLDQTYAFTYILDHGTICFVTKRVNLERNEDSVTSRINYCDFHLTI
jgi:hypothetical protein